MRLDLVFLISHHHRELPRHTTKGLKILDPWIRSSIAQTVFIALLLSSLGFSSFFFSFWGMFNTSDWGPQVCRDFLSPFYCISRERKLEEDGRRVETPPKKKKKTKTTICHGTLRFSSSLIFTFQWLLFCTDLLGYVHAYEWVYIWTTCFTLRAHRKWTIKEPGPILNSPKRGPCLLG